MGLVWLWLWSLKSTRICPTAILIILARPKNNLPTWELLPRTAAGGDLAKSKDRMTWMTQFVSSFWVHMTYSRYLYICYITLMSVIIDSYWCYMQFSSPRMLRLLFENFEGPATTSDNAKAVSQYWHWSPHSPYLCERFCRPLAWLLRNSTDDPATMRYVTCRVWVRMVSIVEYSLRIKRYEKC